MKNLHRLLGDVVALDLDQRAAPVRRFLRQPRDDVNMPALGAGSCAGEHRKALQQRMVTSSCLFSWFFLSALSPGLSGHWRSVSGIPWNSTHPAWSIRSMSCFPGHDRIPRPALWR